MKLEVLCRSFTVDCCLFDRGLRMKIGRLLSHKHLLKYIVVRNQTFLSKAEI